MSFQPRDVLTAFKPKLVPRRMSNADEYWAGIVAELRQVISKAQNAALRTAFDSPTRCAELSTILKSCDEELLTMRIATLGAAASCAFDEMHKGDENYTDPMRPARLATECEFGTIAEGA